MESRHELAAPTTSRFLQLPRELRDLIYEHALVKGIISIECAVTKGSPTRVHDQRNLKSREKEDEPYPLSAPWGHRRVWSVPPFDIDSASTNNTPNPPPAVYMTYQLEKGSEEKVIESVDVSLFQVCRLIYAEASEVFYGNNIFSFTSDFRIPTAFAFLCDRPATSLVRIKSLELSLLEANNMKGTTQAPYPIVRRSTDSLVLQYAYQYFTELCTLLSTSRMRLRKLYLTVETMASDSYTDSGRIGIRDGLALEKRKMVESSRPWIPMWLNPLLKIEGLESLEMRWISNRPQLQRMTDTVGVMQRHMLAGNSRKYTSHALTECVHSSDSLKLQFVFQHDACPDVPVSLEDDSNWREIIADNDGLRHAEFKRRDETKEVERWTDRSHCKQLVESYSEAYVSYFELQSA